MHCILKRKKGDKSTVDMILGLDGWEFGLWCGAQNKSSSHTHHRQELPRVFVLHYGNVLNNSIYVWVRHDVMPEWLRGSFGGTSSYQDCPAVCST